MFENCCHRICLSWIQPTILLAMPTPRASKFISASLLFNRFMKDVRIGLLQSNMIYVGQLTAVLSTSNMNHVDTLPTSEQQSIIPANITITVWLQYVTYQGRNSDYQKHTRGDPFTEGCIVCISYMCLVAVLCALTHHNQRKSSFAGGCCACRISTNLPSRSNPSQARTTVFEVFEQVDCKVPS